jgi:hypothetical protein
MKFANIAAVLGFRISSWDRAPGSTIRIRVSMRIEARCHRSAYRPRIGFCSSGSFQAPEYAVSWRAAASVSFHKSPDLSGLNISWTGQLRLEGEDLAALGFSANPPILATMDLDAVA